jgi:hypothetical protein
MGKPSLSARGAEKARQPSGDKSSLILQRLHYEVTNNQYSVFGRRAVLGGATVCVRDKSIAMQVAGKSNRLGQFKPIVGWEDLKSADVWC